jgi:DNA-binding XRE family transcriptional regulator
MKLTTLLYLIDEAEPVTSLPEPYLRQKLRESCGVNLRDASAAVGVSMNTYTTWEKGWRQAHQSDELIRYAKLLSVLQERVGTQAEEVPA